MADAKLFSILPYCFCSSQALVKGSHTLIVPYVGHVLGSLMKLLNDPSSAVVGAALSTIGKNMGIRSE